MKNLIKRNEIIIIALIFLFGVAVQLRSGQFFTLNNLFDNLYSFVVPGLLAISALLVMISGGIDVSFPMIASLSMYVTTYILLEIDYKGNVILAFIIAALIGLVCGALNGALVSWLKLPALIITLATSSVFQGVLQGVLKAEVLNPLPESMTELGKSAIFIATNSETGTTSKLPTTFVILMIIAIAIQLFFRYTMLGRSIFALGGDESSAERAGFDIVKTKFVIYMLSGMVASVAGICRTCMLQNCEPTNLFGTEMYAIASAVLGGAALTGGSGNVFSTLLGSLLITIVQNSLILLGIPSYWQSFFTGVIILCGIAGSAYRNMILSKKQGSVFRG